MKRTTTNNGAGAASKAARRRPIPLPNGVNGHAHDIAPTPTAPPLNPDATVSLATPNQGAGGRFVEGNRAGAGNPFHRAVAARRKALLAAVSDEDVAAVGRKLKDMSLAGDVPAAKVLLAYCVGRPAEAPDPDRLDIAEFEQLRAWPTRTEGLAMLLELVSPEGVMELLTHVLAAHGDAVAAAAAKMFAGSEKDEASACVCGF